MKGVITDPACSFSSFGVERFEVALRIINSNRALWNFPPRGPTLTKKLAPQQAKSST
jgi:hypothetical protein